MNKKIVLRFVFLFMSPHIGYWNMHVLMSHIRGRHFFVYDSSNDNFGEQWGNFLKSLQLGSLFQCTIEVDFSQSK